MAKVMAIVLSGLMLTLSVSEASAWYCHASSSYGSWGWATNRSLKRAKRTALRQCAVRTPRGYMCYITFCR